MDQTCIIIFVHWSKIFIKKRRFSIKTNQRVIKRVNERRSERENRNDEAEVPSVERCFIHSSREAEKISPEKTPNNHNEKKESGIIFSRRRKIL